VDYTHKETWNLGDAFLPGVSQSLMIGHGSNVWLCPMPSRASRLREFRPNLDM